MTVSYLTSATVVDELHPTMRNVISIVGRFYDPLGYLSSVTIPFEVYMLQVNGTRG